MEKFTHNMKVMMGETDMPLPMQQHAIHLAAQAISSTLPYRCDPQHIARLLKQDFDKHYGGGWQCIVGTNFGSFVTHSHGNFIYFCINKLAFLLFKGMSTSCTCDYYCS